MPITPAVDLDGLLLLLPHELMGLAIIVGMLAIAIGRNHFVSTVIATSGMLAAGISGAMQFYELRWALRRVWSQLFLFSMRYLPCSSHC